MVFVQPYRFAAVFSPGSAAKALAAEGYPRLCQIKKKTDAKASVFGAGDEARTRYLHLGKVALYQMSYTRMGSVNKMYYSRF